MVSVQSTIRAEISRGASPVPKGAEALAAYAIASAKQLIPEMETAARLTLDHPMTFEFLGEKLRLFEGWALRDLVNFRKRYRDGLITCLDSFTKVRPLVPSGIWVGCPEDLPKSWLESYRPRKAVPTWLSQLLSRNQFDLKVQKFTSPFDIHSRIRKEYFTALQCHATCTFCLAVHLGDGSTFYTDLENKLAKVRDKVNYSLYLCTTRFTSYRSQ
jgi:hypothetical protein